MSGSGDRPSDKISDKIKEEVRSALKLLFKNAGQHAIDLTLPVPTTVYEPGFQPEAFSTPLAQPRPEVSMDPIGVLKNSTYYTFSNALLTSATIAPGMPCHIDPVLCREPRLEETQHRLYQVSFDSIRQVTTHPFKTGMPAAKSSASWPVERLKTNTRPIPAPAYQTAARQLPDAKVQTRTEAGNRFYAMPIKKSPIPPHRFSAELRELFRKTLAEKEKIHPANVQLRLIFERMDMSLYSSLQQDEQGNLLCTPKSEFIGQNTGKTTLAGKTPPTQTAYLVFGTRLDNKADLKALVPVSLLEEPKSS